MGVSSILHYILISSGPTHGAWDANLGIQIDERVRFLRLSTRLQPIPAATFAGMLHYGTHSHIRCRTCQWWFSGQSVIFRCNRTDGGYLCIVFSAKYGVGRKQPFATQ